MALSVLKAGAKVNEAVADTKDAAKKGIAAASEATDQAEDAIGALTRVVKKPPLTIYKRFQPTYLKARSIPYQFRVHVIECRSLRSRSNGQADPMVWVQVLDNVQSTEMLKNTLCPYFDDMLIFDNIELAEEEFQGGKVTISVYDANTVRTDVLIGLVEVDFTYIHQLPDHILFRQWLALSDPTDKHEGIQGMIKLSIEVVHEGEDLQTYPLPCLSNDGIENPEEFKDGNKMLIKDPTKAMLQPPVILVKPDFDAKKWLHEKAKSCAQCLGCIAIKNRCVKCIPYKCRDCLTCTDKDKNKDEAFVGEYLLRVTIYVVENLPKMDVIGSVSSQVVVLYNGVKGRTVTRRKNHHPIFNNEIRIPIILPVLSDDVQLGILSRKIVGNDILLGGTTISISKVIESGGCGPLWVNFYGVEKREPTGDLLTVVGDSKECAFYRGRALVKLAAEESREAKLEEKIDVAELMLHEFPEEVTYTLRVDVYEGVSLPNTVSKAWVRVVVGSNEVCSGKVNVNADGGATWFQALDDADMTLPSDIYQVPDVIVQLWIDDDMCGFLRFTCEQILGFDNPPVFATLSSVYTFPEAEIGGLLCFSIGFGKKADCPPMPGRQLTVPQVEKYQFRVNLYQCRNLPPSRSDGLANPYVQVHVGSSSLNFRKQRATRAPVWYESQSIDIEIPVNKLIAPPVRFTVHSQNKKMNRTSVNSKDDLLGHITIPIMDIAESPGTPIWVPLKQYRPGAPTGGEVLVTFQLIPKGKVAEYPVADIIPEQRDVVLELASIGIRDIFPKVKEAYFEMKVSGNEKSEVSAMMQGSKFQDPSQMDTTFIRCTIPINPVFAPSVEIKVMQNRTFKSDKPIGSASIPLTDLLPWVYEANVYSKGLKNAVLNKVKSGKVLEPLRAANPFLSPPGVMNMGTADDSDGEEEEVGPKKRRFGFGRKRSVVKAQGVNGKDIARKERAQVKKEKNKESSSESSSEGSFGSSDDDSSDDNGPGVKEKLKNLFKRKKKRNSMIDSDDDDDDDEKKKDDEGGGVGLELEETEDIRQEAKITPIKKTRRIFRRRSNDDFEGGGGGKRRKSKKDEGAIIELEGEEIFVAEDEETDAGVEDKRALVARYKSSVDTRQDDWSVFPENSIVIPDRSKLSYIASEDALYVDVNIRPKCNNELEKILDSPFDTYQLVRCEKVDKKTKKLGRNRTVKKSGVLKGWLRVRLPEDPVTRVQDLVAAYPEEEWVARLYIVGGHRLIGGEVGLGGNACDCYIKINVGKKKNIKDKGNIQYNSNNPQFMSVYDVPLQFPNEQRIEIQVMDKDKFTRDDVVGSTVFHMEERLYNPTWMNLVTKPTEIRYLRVPSSAMSQGQLEVWAELLTPEEAMRPPPKIGRAPKKKFEMRIVVWKVKDMKYSHRQRKGDLKVGARLVGGTYHSTDTHWGTDDGVGNFNYRLVFPLDLPYEAHHIAPRLVLSIWDQDVATNDDLLAETQISLRQFFLNAYTKESEQRIDKQFINVFHPDKAGDRGRLQFEIHLLPIDEAAKKPVGQGREKPNQYPYLKEPYRPGAIAPWEIHKWIIKFFNRYKKYAYAAFFLSCFFGVVALYVYLRGNYPMIFPNYLSNDPNVWWNSFQYFVYCLLLSAMVLIIMYFVLLIKQKCHKKKPEDNFFIEQVECIARWTPLFKAIFWLIVINIVVFLFCHSYAAYQTIYYKYAAITIWVSVSCSFILYWYTKLYVRCCIKDSSIRRLLAYKWWVLISLDLLFFCCMMAGFGFLWEKSGVWAFGLIVVCCYLGIRIAIACCCLDWIRRQARKLRK